MDGDASDNVAGIPRIKRRVLSKLLNKYASIEGIYANLDKEKLTKFEGDVLVAYREKVLNNFKIIKLNRNLDLLIEHQASFVVENITEIFKKYEIKSIDPKSVIDLFETIVTVKYTDPVPVKLETYSLFD
jgi:5'-3' exonuclease